MNTKKEQNERIEKIEVSLAYLSSQVTALIESGPPQNSPQQMNDDIWSCRSCGARLGVFSIERNELRIRYKDFSVYVVTGKGGKVSVPCRRCGEINVAEDEG